MDLEEYVSDYFAGWNAHDDVNLASLFAETGTYEDPVSRMAVRSYDLAMVLWSIETVLPDFRFEILSITSNDQRATAEWVLRGTNSKALKPGIDPTGKKTTIRTRPVRARIAEARPGEDVCDGRVSHIQADCTGEYRHDCDAAQSRMVS